MIHTAFIHDFSKFQQNCEIDKRAIEAIDDALAGTDKLLIVTAGTAISRSRPDVPATEDDPAISAKLVHRATEEAADSVAAQGVRVAVVRLPQVYDTARQGFVSYAIQVAREKAVARMLVTASTAGLPRIAWTWRTCTAWRWRR